MKQRNTHHSANRPHPRRERPVDPFEGIQSDVARKLLQSRNMTLQAAANCLAALINNDIATVRTFMGKFRIEGGVDRAGLREYLIYEGGDADPAIGRIIDASNNFSMELLRAELLEEEARKSAE
jgi:hypothetical protein